MIGYVLSADGTKAFGLVGVRSVPAERNFEERVFDVRAFGQPRRDPPGRTVRIAAVVEDDRARVAQGVEHRIHMVERQAVEVHVADVPGQHAIDGAGAVVGFKECGRTR